MLPLLILGLLLLSLLASVALYAARGGTLGGDWRTASRAPTGLAPDPRATPEAVIQVYAARAFGWRGAFGVHMWFAVKPAGAASYTRAEVMGFGVARGAPAVRLMQGNADNAWFGNLPDLVADLRGPQAESLIPRILAAAESYPYPSRYLIWPGPNSNTFVAHVARAVPELGLALPSNALGKDYLPHGALFGRAPSGTGWQVSVLGAAGVTLARREGLEVNLFGFVIGLGGDLALKLPGFGDLDWSAIFRIGDGRAQP